MNPFYDPYKILTRVYSDGAHLKIALAEEKIEEAFRAGTVKTVYGVLENDAYLSLCIRTFAPKSPKLVVRTVLKIALYALLYLEKPRYAVTNDAAELLKKIGKGGTVGFVNAFLRNFDEQKVILPAGDEGLAIKYNFPLFAVKKLKEQYGERTERILSAKSRGVTVRFCRGAEQYLQSPHIRTPFEDVYIFEKFVRDHGFFAGDYTFQSVGSVAICSVVEPCENFLDACAAPGGKSVLLAEKCEHVTAGELHKHRLELIKAYCQRMRTENVEPVLSDGAVYRPEWADAFDGVLCDVPCSGLGTVSENPDLALNKREEDIPALNKIQLAILSNCARYVKSGGAIYYSTCSVLREENDGVVEQFLKENPAFCAEKADCPLDHERTRCGLQFLPDTAYGAGFYVSKLRRRS
ncbi:MAG: hypothetical protein K2L87_05445 [Clostridiales bacterium]|nr:hypothetical protein [Clostridiales bacterium]